MKRRAEWLPTTRQGQVDKGIQWLRVLPEETKNAKGEIVQKWQAWGIPEPMFMELSDNVNAAMGALDEAKNEEKRTKVVNKRVAAAFKAMIKTMREVKKRFFYIPPLTEADIVSLGLAVPDSSHSPTGEPTAQVTIETYLVGRHELGLRFIYVKGSADESANKSYRVYYLIAAHGEKAPASPEELTKSFPEQRKTCVKDFGFDASGKTVYMCVRVENGNKAGPWGPMVSALIP